MSTSPPNSSTLHPHHVRNLILILRRANLHYYHVAARNRVNLKPTYHAYMEARRRGLCIDIGRAARCDQRQISLAPLPVLDLSATPASIPSLEVVDTQPSRLDRKPLGRPILKCAIPGVFTRTTPNGTTSSIAVSSSSHLSSVSLSSPVVPSAVLMTKHVKSSRPLSAWTAGEEANRSSVCSDILMEPSVRVPVSPDLRAWQPLDVPIDEEDMDWGLDDITDMDVSPLSPSFDCGSDTASSGTHSSSGPLTPCDEGPIMIRIKRKSIEVCSLTDDFEKRPKFDRKEWAQPATERKNLIRIPARTY